MAKNTISISEDHQQLVLEFSYSRDIVEFVRTISGAKFNWENKLWFIPVIHCKFVIEKFNNFRITPTLQTFIDADTDRERLRIRADAKLAIKASGFQLPPGLYKHQIDGIRWMIQHPRCILADDMGLGKTRQALIAASAFELPILVIVPASLKDVWKREAAIVGVKITLYSWAKLPSPPESDFTLICDEAHYAQDLKSKRTKGMLALAECVFCRSVYLLSGTPMKNGRPSNLFPLLRAVRHPVAVFQRRYEVRYCAAHPGDYVKWDVSGASHLAELHILIKESFLRRTKADTLDLPPKTRTSRKVVLSKTAQAKYKKTVIASQKKYKPRPAAPREL